MNSWHGYCLYNSIMKKLFGFLDSFSAGFSELRHQFEVYLFLRRYIARSSRRAVRNSKAIS